MTRWILAGSLMAALLAAGTAAVSAFSATAAEQPFSQAAFDVAQREARPILVHITAPWCTTCAAQKPILKHLLSEPAFKDMRTFNIDFDTQKQLVGAFGARMQSTLIVFKGKTEEGRSSGDTAPASIESLMRKAL